MDANADASPERPGEREIAQAADELFGHLVGRVLTQTDTLRLAATALRRETQEYWRGYTHAECDHAVLSKGKSQR